MYYSTTYEAPIGKITLASDGEKLIGLWNGSHKYIYKNMQEKTELPIFEHVKKWLDRYFAGEKPCIKELPLALAGSEFRQAVWRILCDIPYGEVVTYGDIAKQMAKKLNKAKMSSQAVGGAVGRNPISIIIPCHRVVGSNGSLTGYGGGIKIKVKLLEHEKVDMTKFFVPIKGTAL
jgi:methylated-DNA-[protein]-cysteine S-methyltransferase